jgi:5-formyltetrahydrofolate cyclo-ligase
MLVTVSDEKKELRKRLLTKLLSLTQKEIKRRSENAEKHLSSLPIYKRAKIIMVYYPLRGEVDILGMVRRDLGLKRFCFPVMDLKTKDLYAYEVKDLQEDFVRGPFDVMQPNTAKTKRVEVKEIDMVVVPALAYDYQRNRLGRGAGFYDRFLRKIRPPAQKIGIAFESQILENLPIHPRLDEKVDLIVSETFSI